MTADTMTTGMIRSVMTTGTISGTIFAAKRNHRFSPILKKETALARFPPAFALQPQRTYGSSGQFVIDAPGVCNWGLAFQKNLRIVGKAILSSFAGIV
jgi:hypothetical protein